MSRSWEILIFILFSPWPVFMSLFESLRTDYYQQLRRNSWHLKSLRLLQFLTSFFGLADTTLLSTSLNFQFRITIMFNLLFISDNASRYCDLNGIWDISNYDNCYIINSFNKSCESEFNIWCSADTSALIYLFGYFSSLFALVVALVIFLSFK